jgi:hypothetical protein
MGTLQRQVNELEVVEVSVLFHKAAVERTSQTFRIFRLGLHSPPVLLFALRPQHCLVRVHRVEVTVHGLDHRQRRVAEDRRELVRVRAARELPGGEGVPEKVRVDALVIPANAAAFRIMRSPPDVVSGPWPPPLLRIL